MTPARAQRLTEARRAMKLSTARVIALQAAREPTELEELQDMADQFAAIHMDTPRQTRDRRRRLA
jgi:hypothetical protein